MNLHLNPDRLRLYMKLWRDSLNHAIPLAPEIKLHFIQERPAILDNYVQTAKAWLMVLNSTTPEAADKSALDGFIGEVTEFMLWAEEGLKEQQTLQTQSMIEAGMDELRVTDPDLYNRMMDSFKKLLPPSKPGGNGTDN